MAQNSSPDRVESAGDITLIVSKRSENGVEYSEGNIEGIESGDVGNDASFIRIPISRLDTTKEIEISEIRESSIKANGYSIDSISYSGTMTFKGSRVTKTYPDAQLGEKEGISINKFLYNEYGVPVPFAINISHDLAGEPDRYTTCLVASDSYEVRSEETTETAFDWVSMDRNSDQPGSQ